MEAAIYYISNNGYYAGIAGVVYIVKAFVPVRLLEVIVAKSTIDQLIPAMSITASFGIILLSVLGVITWIRNERRYREWAKRGFKKEERDQYGQ